MFTIYTQILFYISLCNICLYSQAIPTELTYTDNYLPPDDPNNTNLIISHSDCKKQHHLRQFKPLQTFNVLKFERDFMFELKLSELKFLNVKLTLRRKEKLYFQGSIIFRRVDGTVWNHITLPLPITLDPLECKILIRHPNGTNNKILNNFRYNCTFTLLEDHYFQEKLKQYQTLFTVYNFNTMYSGTFT